MSVSSVNPAVEAMFSALSSRQTQMRAMAQNALSQGATLYTNGNYDAAAQQFKRAIALDPSSGNATQAYDLLATVYIQQDKTDDAIKAYKSSISMVPQDDNAHTKLGNIYFSQANYADAEKEYKSAVNINPTSSTNLYSLGQVYLFTDRYQDAENAFQKVIKMDPTQYGGYYALGQTYSKEGRAEDAIAQFEKVTNLKKDFYNVYIDLGSAYADLGQTDKAQEQLDILNDKAPDLSTHLSTYIDKVTKPKILGAYNTSGFTNSLGPGTEVSLLDPSLASSNASQVFNMVFVFSKEMDTSSVQKSYNWSISKAPSSSPGGGYNWGESLPSTEAQISPIPMSVVYLPDSLTATISFLIDQNADANATMDPSHLVFRFNGTDAYGNAMDPAADEFSGISLIA